MRTEEAMLTEAVDRLGAVEDAAFLDTLWLRVEQAEDRARRRWRIVAFASVLVALAALGSTAVIASSHGPAVLDRTIRCAGLEPHIAANADTPAQTFPGAKPQAGGLHIWVNEPVLNGFVSFDDAHGGQTIDQNALCHAAKRIQFGSKGLAAAEVYRSGGYLSFERTCHARGPYTVRMRIVHDGNDVPTSAQVALSAGSKPLVYIDWTPAKVSTHSAARFCR